MMRERNRIAIESRGNAVYLHHVPTSLYSTYRTMITCRSQGFTECYFRCGPRDTSTSNVVCANRMYIIRRVDASVCVVPIGLVLILLSPIGTHIYVYYNVYYNVIYIHIYITFDTYNTHPCIWPSWMIYSILTFAIPNYNEYNTAVSLPMYNNSTPPNHFLTFLPSSPFPTIVLSPLYPYQSKNL